MKIKAQSRSAAQTGVKHITFSAVIKFAMHALSVGSRVCIIERVTSKFMLGF